MHWLFDAGLPPEMLAGMEERRTGPAREDDPADLQARYDALVADTTVPAGAVDQARVADADWRVGDAAAAGRSVVDVAAQAADAEWERRNAELGRSIDDATGRSREALIDRAMIDRSDWRQWCDDAIADADDHGAVR